MSDTFNRYTGHVISKHETMLGWYERQEKTMSSDIFDQGTFSRAYTLGYAKPHHSVPAIASRARIQPHIVDIVTPMQSKFPDENRWNVNWTIANEHGVEWSVAHWWNDTH